MRQKNISIMAVCERFFILTFVAFLGWPHLFAAASQRQRVIAFFQQSCETALPNPCQQVCTNIKSGGFYCQCDSGYTINKDGMTCTEVRAPPTRTSKFNKSKELDNNSVVSHLHETIAKVPTLNHRPLDNARSKGGHEVVISDHDHVRVKSVDLTNGLAPLESDSYRRKLKTDSSLVLNRGFYNIPEGGSPNNGYGNIDFNSLDIPEGGEEEDAEQLFSNGVELLPEKEEATCADVICENNGTCAILDSKAVCMCPLGTSGTNCQTEVEVRYPKFLGTGYLALPVLRKAHKAFTVSLEFRPESQNGLVLFSGELSRAKKDFFSLALVDGFVVYRFDCGTGAAELRTPNSVTLAAWNRIEISRVDNHGTVRLNGEQEMEGTAQGDYTRITFRLNLYVGGFEDMPAISKLVATPYSYVGCVQHLLINGHAYDFRQQGLVGEAEFGANVGECSEGVCEGVVCHNGGSCVVKSADQHLCLCPMGYHGESCEKDGPVHVPHFSGHSYVEFPGLARSVLSYTEVEVVFKPTSVDGTLLYNGFSRDRKGDFIALALRDGHLEFRFDLGTGPAVIRSLEPLATNQWHLVRASRTGLMGTLDIDGQIQVNGQAEGAYTQLTLLDNLYLGGHPNFDHTSKHANLTRSFSGCLQKVVINKHTLNLLGDAVSGVNIAPCSHPCAGRPCLNGGECQPVRDTYICYCPLGYANTNCEDVQSQLPTKPMFGGDSYLVYTDMEITKRVTGSRMDLQLHIRPRGRDGLIFWSGEDLSNKSARDYIALVLHGGSLQLRYNLGSGEALIGYNDSRLFDGNWHFIRVQRDKQDTYMEIDKKEVVEGSSPGGYTSLNTNKAVFLGGMPNVAEKTGGRFTLGFVGCLKDLKLATDYDVKLLAQAHSGRNIVQCRKKMFV